MQLKRPEKFSNEVEAIKLALGTIQYSGGSVKNTFVLCLKKYLELYGTTDDDMYLNNALLHMQAFFEMGFAYEEFPVLFDEILSKAGFLRAEVFPKRFYQANKVKLIRGQVRNMIHRWSPSKYHSLSINDVVDDIIKKVKEKEIGCYFYHSNQNPKKNNDDLYELVISEEEIFFYDVARKKYYIFVE